VEATATEAKEEEKEEKEGREAARAETAGWAEATAAALQTTRPRVSDGARERGRHAGLTNANGGEGSRGWARPPCRPFKIQSLMT
jgi:hypothetical protein